MSLLGVPQLLVPPGTFSEGGTQSKVGIPPPPRPVQDGVAQQNEYLLWSGRYASCVHAGLSCYGNFNQFLVFLPRPRILQSLKKKVLLRERKRHTGRRVSSTPDVPYGGGTPIQSWLRVPPISQMEVPPPPSSTLEYPPSPPAGWGYPPPHWADGVPPPPPRVWTDKLKTVPSPILRIRATASHSHPIDILTRRSPDLCLPWSRAVCHDFTLRLVWQRISKRLLIFP